MYWIKIRIGPDRAISVGRAQYLTGPVSKTQISREILIIDWFSQFYPLKYAVNSKVKNLTIYYYVQLRSTLNKDIHLTKILSLNSLVHFLNKMFKIDARVSYTTIEVI